jgi:drug/metabolite transporter (DMT)-like permease
MGDTNLTRGANRLAFAALIAGNVALAFGPWFVRLADTGPVAAGFWRVALAAPLLLAIAWRGGWRPAGLGKGLWWMIGIAGVSFAADLGSWHLGILRTTMANATLFGNCATLIFPLYGFFVLRAWPSRTQGLALLLAAIGGALLMGQSYSLNPRNLAGDLLCLFAGVLYTLYFIIMARVRETTAPLTALGLASFAAILPLLLAAWLLGEQIRPHDWWPLLGLVLVSQLIGQGLMIYALGKLPPLVIGLALLTQPVVAAAVGWIVYDETLGAADLSGAILVAVALVLVSRTPVVAPAPGGVKIVVKEPR